MFMMDSGLGAREWVLRMGLVRYGSRQCSTLILVATASMALLEGKHARVDESIDTRWTLLLLTVQTHLEDILLTL